MTKTYVVVTRGDLSNEYPAELDRVNSFPHNNTF